MSSMRTVIYALAVVAGIALALLLLPFITLSEDINTYVTWAFWISFVALLIALYLVLPQRARFGRGAGRMPGICPLPVQQSGRRPFLAADTALRRRLVAGRRFAQAWRPCLGLVAIFATRLLGARCGYPRALALSPPSRMTGIGASSSC